MQKSAPQTWLRYPGYRGDMVFCVEHPDLPTRNVFARSGVGAIIVAADDWGMDWSFPLFFNSCKATYMGRLRNEVAEDG